MKRIGSVGDTRSPSHAFVKEIGEVEHLSRLANVRGYGQRRLSGINSVMAFIRMHTVTTDAALQREMSLLARRTPTGVTTLRPAFFLW